MATRTGSAITVRITKIAAIKAGLQLGDVIEAVDGEELKSLWMLHEVVESHQTDEAMNFRVRRPSGEIKFVSIVRARA